jgi:hypothetical protein
MKQEHGSLNAATGEAGDRLGRNGKIAMAKRQIPLRHPGRHTAKIFTPVDIAKTLTPDEFIRLCAIVEQKWQQPFGLLGGATFREEDNG